MGSISSVPLGFKNALPECERPAVRQQLLVTLRHLHRLHHTLGKEIVLALEPEPGCLLETTDEVCQFFAWLDLPDALRPYLGVCYDCCHQAVQFGEPRHLIGAVAGSRHPDRQGAGAQRCIWMRQRRASFSALTKRAICIRW